MMNNPGLMLKGAASIRSTVSVYVMAFSLTTISNRTRTTIPVITNPSAFTWIRLPIFLVGDPARPERVKVVLAVS